MSSSRSRLLLAVSALVVSAPFVLAADVPTLTGLDRTEVKKGARSNVKAIGENFGEKIEDVTVTAGGTECKVTEVTPKYLRFVLPDTLVVGAATISIKVNKTTLTAKLQVVEKLTQPDKRNAVEGPAGGGPAIQPPATKTQLTLVGGESPSAVVEGSTEIPVGLMLECQVVLVGGNGEDDCIIETKKFRLDKPQFKLTFGPYPGKTLAPGKYFSLVEFFIERANKADLKAAKWDVLDADHRRAYAHIWSKDIRDWGTPDETKKTIDELKAHYTDLTKQATTVFENLERSYGAAGKSYYRKATGSGYDEDAWLAWAKQRGLALTEDDTKKLKADTRFVNAGGAINEAPWRAFLEKDIFKALADLHAAHNAFHNKYVGVANTKMDVEGFELISVAGKQAQTYASELYTKAKIDVPDTIKNPVGVFDGHDVPSASRVEFENKRKVLLERLDKAVAAAPAPAAAASPAPKGK